MGYLNEGIHKQLQHTRLGGLTGKLDKQQLNILANNPKAQFLYDAKYDYINVVQKVDDVLLRITVLRDDFKIISVGPIRERNLINSIKNGRFIPIGEELKDLLKIDNYVGSKP